MKFLVVLAVAVAFASADLEDVNSPILRSSYDSNPNGEFSYGFETGNKIQVQANGVVKNPNGDLPYLELSGSYRYISPDGTPVEIQYIAGENGYQATGSHIPVAPPVPDAIVRSLAYIAAHPPPVAKTN